MMGCAHHPSLLLVSMLPRPYTLCFHLTPRLFLLRRPRTRVAFLEMAATSGVLRKERLPKRSNKKKLVPSCTLLN